MVISYQIYTLQIFYPVLWVLFPPLFFCCAEALSLNRISFAAFCFKACALWGHIEKDHSPEKCHGALPIYNCYGLKVKYPTWAHVLNAWFSVDGTIFGALEPLGSEGYWRR